VNILLINHYAGSPALGMEYRPYYLAREWVRLGHRVQVLAADFSHVRTVQPPPGDSVVDGIAYRFHATPAYQGNGLGRVKNILAFLRQVWADTPRLVRDGENGLVLRDGEQLSGERLRPLLARADVIARDNRAWVERHALFAPCVQAFVRRLQEIAA